jgi:hypothetical protein
MIDDITNGGSAAFRSTVVGREGGFRGMSFMEQAKAQAKRRRGYRDL